MILRPRTPAIGLAAAALLLTLAGCATSPPPAAPTSSPEVAANVPEQWFAPLPHGGQLADLSQWWQRFDDPLLPQLIDAAEAASPTLASATSRIAQARATRLSAGAALGPTLDAAASVSRGLQTPATPINPVATVATVGLQAAWELDLFGANRAGRDAAQARLDGAQADWHDARVAIAAEVASSYIGLRACEALAAQTQLDADSRQETSRLMQLTVKAGFQAPADAALAAGSAAQARSQLTAQRAQCDLDVKALVALTGRAEPALREQLAGAGTARLPQPAAFDVATLPAATLAQRPDVYSAERALVAASRDVDQSEARRWPRISLAGNFGPMRISTGAGDLNGTVWSIGPLAVTMPLFDGGVRRANVDAARARFDEAGALYRARLRTAVREVEEALVNLQSAEQRSPDVQAAADGFGAAYRATDARFKGGLASLFELEDARRNAVQAQTSLIDVQRARSTSWIALYRALGGGWSSADTATAAR